MWLSFILENQYLEKKYKILKSKMDDIEGSSVRGDEENTGLLNLVV